MFVKNDWLLITWFYSSSFMYCYFHDTISIHFFTSQSSHFYLLLDLIIQTSLQGHENEVPVVWSCHLGCLGCSKVSLPPSWAFACQPPRCNLQPCLASKYLKFCVALEDLIWRSYVKSVKQILRLGINSVRRQNGNIIRPSKAGKPKCLQCFLQLLWLQSMTRVRAYHVPP